MTMRFRTRLTLIGLLAVCLFAAATGFMVREDVTRPGKPGVQLAASPSPAATIIERKKTILRKMMQVSTNSVSRVRRRIARLW